jgi:hypothetical protein
MTWLDAAEHRRRYLAWLKFYRAHSEKLPRIDKQGRIRDVLLRFDPYPPEDS